MKLYIESPNKQLITDVVKGYTFTLGVNLIFVEYDSKIVGVINRRRNQSLALTYNLLSKEEYFKYIPIDEVIDLKDYILILLPKFGEDYKHINMYLKNKTSLSKTNAIILDETNFKFNYKQMVNVYEQSTLINFESSYSDFMLNLVTSESSKELLKKLYK